MAKGGMTFEGAGMERAIALLGAKTDAYIGAIVDYSAAASEKAMKENAPWTDRTANARTGLRAVPGHTPGVSHWVDLLHSVSYGIWLEVRWAGRYAIILPTLQVQGPAMMARIAGLFRRLGGGLP